MIKKFKNGNVLLDNREDFKKGIYTSQQFYDYEITMKDLYIVCLEYHLYIADYNTGLFYDLPYNNVQLFFEELEKNSIKLYSYGKRFSKVLFKELEELEND